MHKKYAPVQKLSQIVLNKPFPVVTKGRTISVRNCCSYISYCMSLIRTQEKLAKSTAAGVKHVDAVTWCNVMSNKPLDRIIVNTA